MPSNIVSVEKSQLDAQSKQTRVVISGNLGMGVLTTYYYWSIADQNFLAGWLAGLFIIQVFRYLIFVDYNKREYTEKYGRRWLNIYMLGTFITGSCWGVLGSALVLSHKGEDLVILFLAMIALTGGNIATSAYKKRLFMAFSTPVLVPAGILGFFGDQVTLTLGALSIALWIMSWIAIRRLNDSLVQALTLGVENQLLVDELKSDKEELEKTNVRLSKELQQKLSMTKWLATGNWNSSGPEPYAKADISNGNFSDALIDTWEMAIEEQKPLSMVIFQVDNLTEITKTLDQDQGLIELQRLICSEIRGHDQYLRINDLEFALILANMPATDATSMVNRIRNKLASQPTPLYMANGSPITVSFGVAGWVPDVTQNSGELVSACRKAKDLSIKEGGNRVNIG